MKPKKTKLICLFVYANHSSSLKDSFAEIHEFHESASDIDTLHCLDGGKLTFMVYKFEVVDPNLASF